MDVSVVIKYGNYEIPYHEQEFHDEWIEQFKHVCRRIWSKQGVNVTRTPIIEAEYHPEARKFKLFRISRMYRSAIMYMIETNPDIFKQYIIKNEDISYI